MIIFMKKIVITADCIFILLCSVIPIIAKWMLSLNKICFSLKIGIICPACGGTRCINSMFKGDFISALNYNPAVFFGFFYFSIILLLFNMELFIKNRILTSIRNLMLNPIVLTVEVFFYILFGFARNFL